MSIIDALKSSRRIRRRLVEFAQQDYYLSDPTLQDALGKLWQGPAENGGLTGELWVEGAFPPKRQPVTMAELAKSGELTTELVSQLDSSGAFKATMPPYEHQLLSIRGAKEGYIAKEKPTILVSSGTGSGKTESFLIPMLDELYRNPSRDGEGVSAIILYPMNALVADQVDRLMAWLRNQAKVTAFHFTSETPESVIKAREMGLRHPGKWTFASREHARGNEDETGKAMRPPGKRRPDILVTNYSMLEYMLCRPQDACFFGKNLRTIVLDEAHLYTGNLAAEISMLLRRVYARCGKDPSDILSFATSATIQDSNRLATESFAAKLFTKPEGSTRMIIGKKDDLPPLPKASREDMSLEDFASAEIPPEIRALDETPQGPVLHRLSPESSSWIFGDLSKLGVKTGNTEFTANLLWDALPQSAPFQAVLRLLHEHGRMRLDSLAKAALGIDDERAKTATQKLLSYGAMARERADSLPLLPNRIHYMLRAPDGVSACFTEKGDVGYDGKVSLTLGSPYQIEREKLAWLTLGRDKQTGVAYLAGLIERPGDGSTILRELPAAARRGNLSAEAPVMVFHARPPAGASPTWWFEPCGGSIEHAQRPGLVPLYQVSEEIKASDLVYFAIGSTAYMSVIGSLVSAEMPEYASDDRHWKPAGGRRLLVFSDSRREAARLGTQLGLRHEERVIQRCIAEEFGRSADSALKAQELRAELGKPGLGELTRDLIRAELSKLGGEMTTIELLERVRSSRHLRQIFARAQSGAHKAHEWDSRAFDKNHAHIIADISQRIGNVLIQRASWPAYSLETTGILSVIYPDIEKLAVPDTLAMNLAPSALEGLRMAWPDFLSSILDHARTRGVITLNRFGNASDDRAEGVVYPGKWLTRDAEANASYKIALCEIGSTSAFWKFASRLIDRLDLRDSSEMQISAGDLLKAAYVALESGNLPWLETQMTEGRNGAQAGLRVVLAGLRLKAPEKTYICVQTGEVVGRNVAGTFIGAHEDVDLKVVSQQDLDKHPRVGRYRQLARISDLTTIGIWSEEHTAQLSPQENRRIQDLFKIGARNLLSSTTTLELGIDIGGLQGVLLSNVPPGKANYLQRAGRAGRRADGSSLVVTFSRGTSYEREVFLNFGGFLGASLRRPTVLLERTTIVRRHLFAYLINEFFRGQQKESTGAMRAYDRFGNFCGRPPIPYVNADTVTLDTVSSQAQKPIHENLLKWLAGKDALKHTERLTKLAEGSSELRGEIMQDGGKSLVDMLRRELERAVKQWREEYDMLYEKWSENVPRHNRNEPGARRRLNAIYHQAKVLFSKTTIQSLSEAGILPRYGFPIGLNSLKVINGDRKELRDDRPEETTRLERSSIQALGEYVPGSVLLAGGRYIKSRGILMHWTGSQVRSADNGLGAFYDFTIIDKRIERAIMVPGQSQMKAGNVDVELCGELLMPKHGYTTAASEQPSYVGKIHSVRNTHTLLGKLSGRATVYPTFGGIGHISCQFDPETEIFAISCGDKGKGYAICHACGYATSDTIQAPPTDKLAKLPNSFKYHIPLNRERGATCMAEGATVFRNIYLGANQQTHACIFDLGSDYAAYGHKAFNALAHALALSAAKLLEIDQREISALECTDTPQLTIYESAAGGVGHLQELTQPDRQAEWLDSARQLLLCDAKATPDERTLCLRILTARSPTEKESGIPKFDCLAAREILRGNKAPVPSSVPKAIVVPPKPKPRR